MAGNLFLKRMWKSVLSAFPQGRKTSWWLIKITVPVSLAVFLLDFSGILKAMAVYTAPFFTLFNLPGISAIVLITSVFTNIYSVVAVLTTLEMPLREGTIIAAMCLVSHGFPIETAVLRKTGSAALRMIALRLTASMLIGIFLNLVMPGTAAQHCGSVSSGGTEFGPAFLNWLSSISVTILKIVILVNLLLIFQKMMEEFKWTALLEKPLKPLMRIFGLPENTTFSWIVANAIGLAYGSAVMISLVEEGRIRKSNADLLNHHIAVSHSQVEDPLLFLTLGYTIHWLIWPRVLLAMAAVWLRKLEKSLRGR